MRMRDDGKSVTHEAATYCNMPLFVYQRLVALSDAKILELSCIDLAPEWVNVTAVSGASLDSNGVLIHVEGIGAVPGAIVSFAEFLSKHSSPQCRRRLWTHWWTFRRAFGGAAADGNNALDMLDGAMRRLQSSRGKTKHPQALRGVSVPGFN